MLTFAHFLDISGGIRRNTFKVFSASPMSIVVNNFSTTSTGTTVKSDQSLSRSSRCLDVLLGVET